MIWHTRETKNGQAAAVLAANRFSRQKQRHVAPWLSWPKRLSSKREIRGFKSHRGLSFLFSLLFLYYFSFYFPLQLKLSATINVFFSRHKLEPAEAAPACILYCTHSGYSIYYIAI